MAERTPETLRKLAAIYRPEGFDEAEQEFVTEAEWTEICAALEAGADALEAANKMGDAAANNLARAERAEAERDALRADHEANSVILSRLGLDLPMAAGFRGGCENFSEIFDLVVEEHQALRSTLAAVREKIVRLQQLTALLTRMEEEEQQLEEWCAEALALLDGTAPEQGK